MAAVTPLPAINPHSAGGSSGFSPMMKHEIVEPTPPSTVAPNKLYLKPLKKTQGKKDREMAMRREYLRAQQPMLEKHETTEYRYTFLHNLCLDMLQAGYHQSYSILFALVKDQRAKRESAGPDSLIWNDVLLEDEHEKLEMLKCFLTNAEAADRLGDYREVYLNEYQLAKYFQETRDKWLADTFFSRCLETSAKVTDDGNMTLAEGHCNMGLSFEESKQYLDAADHFEEYYNLTKGHSDWLLKDGGTMHSGACNHLVRIYTAIGNGCATTDYERSLEYLLKAYNMAQEGGDKKLEGDASYRLGIGYEKNGDAKTALVYLFKCFDICKALNDNHGLGFVCEAIAKAYERQEKVDESIKYLEMFVEVAEKSEEKKSVSRACSDLGAIFNSLSRYEDAAKYFTKAYDIARSLNDKEAISSSRVQYGIAMAHKMMCEVATHVDVANRPCLERMVEWKSTRNSSFDKPIPEEVDPVSVEHSTVETPVSQEDDSQVQGSEGDEGIQADVEDNKDD